METAKWTIRKHIPKGYEDRVVTETEEFSSVDELMKVGFVRGWLKEDNKLHLDGDTLELVMRGGRFSNMYVVLGEIEGDINLLKLQFDKYDTMAEIEWENAVMNMRKAVNSYPVITPSNGEQEMIARDLLCEASNGIDEMRAMCDDLHSKRFYDELMSTIGHLEKLLNNISGWNVASKMESED